MIDILKTLIGDFKFTGDMMSDSIGLLAYHGIDEVPDHTARVTAQAKKLAAMFGEDAEAAEAAGLLHDISKIIPADKQLGFAEALGIAILPEERPCPSILHQKLSAALAKELFGVADDRVLSAIGCHTTLKKDTEPLDLILFVADKLQWNQKDNAPFIEEVKEGLNKSLKQAAFGIIKHLMNNKASMPVVHPWTAEAYEALEAK